MAITKAASTGNGYPSGMKNRIINSGIGGGYMAVTTAGATVASSGNIQSSSGSPSADSILFEAEL